MKKLISWLQTLEDTGNRPRMKSSFIAFMALPDLIVNVGIDAAMSGGIPSKVGDSNQH